MKKVIFITGLTSILALSACGNNDQVDAEAKQNDNSESASESDNQNKSSEETEDEDVEEPEEDIEEATSELSDELNDDGEVFEEGFGYMRFVGVGLNDEINLDYDENSQSDVIEMGPMNITIDSVAVVDFEPDDEDISYIFDDEERVRAILMDMTVENTSDEDVTFYPNNSVLVTDTGEQLESDMFMMGDQGGEFFGKVKKEGQTWWLLNDLETDISSIKMIIDPPYDMENYEDLTEEKRLDFEVISWKEAAER